MNARVLLAVARWEILRFVKVKELVLGTLFLTVTFLGVGFAGDLIEHLRSRPRQIGVVGGPILGLADVDALGLFTLVPQSVEGSDWSQTLTDADLDGILEAIDADTARLHVRGGRSWHAELLALVAAHRQEQRVAEAGLPVELLAQLAAPMDLTVEQVVADASSPASFLTAAIVAGAMLLGLFLGFSYVFVAITGEKTQMVTESVLSAISPQQWIDGKILGLSVVVLFQLASSALAYGLSKLVAWGFLDRPWSTPGGLGDPVTLFWMLLFATLGFGFWFTLFALVAATISDPNSSSRSSLMFLPFLPLALTFAGIDSPDAIWMRILALAPGLSPTAMPLRILRGDPAVWEIALSVALLGVSIHLLRRIAGKVFGISMLMTGKEPGWREVLRWIREPA